MLLAIFGAGATYDSIYPHDLPDRPVMVPAGGDRTSVKVGPREWTYPDRPPLANHLVQRRDRFGAAIERYGPCRSLVSELRRIGERGGRFDLEAELERVQEAARTEPRRARELIAFRYYLRDILAEVTTTWSGLSNGTTNYHTLLATLDSWSGASGSGLAMVTFNYDTMLEVAARDVLEIDMSRIEAYVAHPHHLLIKPHGSIDWGIPIRAGLPSPSKEPAEYVAQVISNVGELELEPDAVRLSGANANFFGDQPVLPAVAIPVQSKTTFACPGSHLDVFAQQLSDVDRVLVVGWRATEEHFLNVLRGRLKNPIESVLIVNGDPASAQEAARILQQATELPEGVFRPTKLGFSHLVSGNEQGSEALAALLGA